MRDSNFSIKLKGHVHIMDAATQEVLLDKDNAIHAAHATEIVARGLSNTANQQIYKLKLGNGGTNINGSGQIVYLTPNVTGASATLYNSTYEELVDDSAAGVPSDNSVVYQMNSVPANTAVVIVTCVLSAAEPSGQDATDSGDIDPNAQYAFDELGLFTADDMMLSHIIFSPILKTSNRELVLTYTITIAAS